MRMLPLPTQVEALRPILDDLNNYIKHYDAIDLEADLNLGELEISTSVRLGALAGDPEARQIMFQAIIQGHFDTRPWIRPRLDAFYKLLESPPPSTGIFPPYLDFPFEWPRDTENDYQRFEQAFNQWSVRLILEAKPGEYPGQGHALLKLARKLSLEILDLLDVPPSPSLSQRRLKAYPNDDPPRIVLDDSPFPASQAAAVYVEELIKADGHAVSFAAIKKKRPELEGAVPTRLIKSLDRRIRDLIEQKGKGSPLRLKVEQLK